MKRKRIVFLAVALLALLMSVACSSSSEDSRMDTMLMQGRSAEIGLDHDADTAGSEQATVSESNRDRAREGNIIDSERKVMYTADLDIIVTDFQKAESTISELVQKEKGYIVSTNVHSDENDLKSGHMTVKVPQSSFPSFLQQIEKVSTEVINQRVEGEDVTEEYVDLRARLQAKKDVMARLNTFLKEATTTKDLLSVSEQMGKVQEEIESLEGRLNYLKNQTDYSTVTIHMMEKNLKVGELGSQDQNTWLRAKQLFVATINGILAVGSGVVVFLIGFSPVILPLLLIILVFFIFRKKRKSE